MPDPLATINTRRTAQREQADHRQRANNAGGYTFTIDPMARLRRFLTLGVDGGTYYVRERELTKGNAAVMLDLAAHDTTRVVEEITEISLAGRAPRQNPALFALAACSGLGDKEGRHAAHLALTKVARTGTHLFTFLGYCKQFRGWGAGLRRAVQRWYLDKPVERVAYQTVKYRQRNGYTHRDALRLAHPVPDDAVRDELFGWAVGKPHDGVPMDGLEVVEGFELAQRAESARAVAELIGDYPLSWEMLPDQFLNEAQVWDALLRKGIPQTALMRQLPRLTKLGMLNPLGTWTKHVAKQLADPERLRKARVHPVNVLVAQRTYAAGHSARGESSWTPSRPIVDALDAAFYNAFGAVEPSGKRTMLALDVSGSMGCNAAGNLPLTAREASAALALVTAATEKDYTIVGFTGGHGGYRGWGRDTQITPLSISPRQRLDDVIRYTERLPFGGTDCSLPMLYAERSGFSVDTFVIYTDNETWAGQMHPHQALRQYRERTGIDAKLTVVGMTATEFSIADPTDPGMLDVAGFDAAVPNLISDFARGM